MLVLYGGLLFLTGWTFKQVPTGFIPLQDKGYQLADVQLLDAASMQSTRAICSQVDAMIAETKGVAHRVGIEGMGILTGVALSSATNFVVLDEFDMRYSKELYSDNIAATPRKKYATLRGARIGFYGAPPVDGLGTSAGMKMQLQDKGSLGYGTLQGMGENLQRAATADYRRIQFVPGRHAAFPARHRSRQGQVERHRPERTVQPSPGDDRYALRQRRDTVR